MKTTRYMSRIWLLLFILFACEQELIDREQPETPEPEPACPDGASKGTADFTKFVAIGNSFVAGVQGGALFTTGQNNSLPAIMNKQFECVGAPATFNQPTINASLGWNLFVTQPFLSNGTSPVLGRLLLEYSSVSCTTGQPTPSPTPQAYAAGNVEAVPNPGVNPAFIYGNGSTKAALNNFGIPAIVLGQSLIQETGAWAGAGSDPRFSPFYGRLAYPGTGTSTIIGDAAAAGGTFFLFWLGLDDFFLHAAFGADPSLAPLTSTGLFGAYYEAALSPTTGLLASNPALKGVVGNFPDIFKMPHFTSVSYKPIPLDATTAAQLTAAFTGYNAALDGLIANKEAFGISDDLAAEIATRKLEYKAACDNKILIIDEDLEDLGPYFDALETNGAIDDAERAALVPYEQVRQTTATDIIPFATGSILGKPGTFGVNGVSEPLADRWVIIPSERDAINAARTGYNSVVAGVVSANSTRLALADISKALDDFVTAQAYVLNGVTITPNINPPTGIYSEDGVHPNTRGYAFLGGVFIEAINAKFEASVPKPNLALYSATGLPVSP